VCYIKSHKENLEQIAGLHNYYTPKKLDLHVHFLTQVFLKKCNEYGN
jgi:hypothetical protein